MRKSKRRRPSNLSIGIFLILVLLLLWGGLIIYDRASDRASAEEFEEYRVAQREAGRPIDATELLKLWSDSEKTNLANDPRIREILLTPPNDVSENVSPALRLQVEEDHHYQEINLAPLILEGVAMGLDEFLVRWRNALLYRCTSIAGSFLFFTDYKKRNTLTSLPIYAGDEAFYRRSMLRCLRAWETTAQLPLNTWDYAKVEKSAHELCEKHRDPGDELGNPLQQELWGIMGLFVIGLEGTATTLEFVRHNFLCYDALIVCYTVKTQTGELPETLAKIPESLLSTETTAELQSFDAEIKSTVPLIFTYQGVDEQINEWPNYDSATSPQSDR